MLSHTNGCDARNGRGRILRGQSVVGTLSCMLNVDAVAAALNRHGGGFALPRGRVVGDEIAQSSQYGDRNLIPIAATLALLLDLQGRGMR